MYCTEVLFEYFCLPAYFRLFDKLIKNNFLLFFNKNLSILKT